MRILLRLRKESANLLIARAGQDDGTRNLEEVLDSDVIFRNSEAAEARESLKMRDRCGNVYENKGSLWKTGAEAGMSMKTNVLAR